MALPGDQTTQSFTKVFNQAQALFAQDKMAECEQAARALLEDPTMPHYHRVRTLLLLVNIVPEWYEAWRFHQEAKQYWHTLRLTYPHGHDSAMDNKLQELWDGILELAQMLQDDIEVDPDPEWIEAQEEADARALGMTIDQMREITASKAARNSTSHAPTPKFPFGLAPSQAATATLSSGTGVAVPPDPQNTDSSKAKKLLAQTVAESRAYGFGGGSPYRNPMVKDKDNPDPDPSAPVDPSYFQMEGIPPILGRARSLRKKQDSYRNTPWKKSIPRRTQGPEDSDNNRPPQVLPKFAVELWGKPEEEKDKGGN